jgi:hypothetical protein
VKNPSLLLVVVVAADGRSARWPSLGLGWMTGMKPTSMQPSSIRPAATGASATAYYNLTKTVICTMLGKCTSIIKPLHHFTKFTLF